MPISALQHRVSAGAYQNKLHDNIRGSYTTQVQSQHSDRSVIPDEIHHLGRSINSLSFPVLQLFIHCINKTNRS